MQLTLAATLLLPLERAGAQMPDNEGPAAGLGSISTPRPINPAAGTTNPSARATQTLNPYLGSTPAGPLVAGEMKLTLQEAVARGLRFNLGLIDSVQSDAVTRAQRERALAALLPQISARARQTYEDLSYRELGLRLPPQFGFQLPATSGGFGYSDSRIALQAPVLDFELLARYKARKALEEASILSTKDARDVVVFAVGAAFFQVIASQARLATAQAALTSARALDAQIADQYKSELAPEIDTLRAQVLLGAAGQRVVNATNDLEKDKLTLDRITGVPLAQAWTATGEYGYAPLPDVAGDSTRKFGSRFDLQSARRAVSAAQLEVKAARAERLPTVSFEANYGAAGLNPGNYNQVYSITGGVSVPLFTGGRIRADVEEGEAALARRRAEYSDLQGRIDYDVRVALLDAKASESAIKVAANNQKLAERALAQSGDRFQNGVTNYLEVVQAQETLVAAKENYIASLFSFNVAKITLARALGSAESRLATLFQAQ